jgi:hypothetical protein
LSYIVHVAGQIGRDELSQAYESGLPDQYVMGTKSCVRLGRDEKS